MTREQMLNIAMDIAINKMIVQAGITGLPIADGHTQPMIGTSIEPTREQIAHAERAGHHRPGWRFRVERGGKRNVGV